MQTYIAAAKTLDSIAYGNAAPMAMQTFYAHFIAAISRHYDIKELFSTDECYSSRSATMNVRCQLRNIADSMACDGMDSAAEAISYVLRGDYNDDSSAEVIELARYIAAEYLFEMRHYTR